MAATLSNTTTARKDGVRVDKGIEPGDNHMRVHYRIRNTREDDAAIRVEESLTAAFPLEALDLDTGAGGGDWLLDGANARVALVDIVAAGEEVTTGYVVRCEDPNAVESVIDAPEIDMVDPVDGDGGTTAPTTSAGAARANAAGRGQSASEGTAGGASDEAVDAAAVAAAMDPSDVAAALDAETVVAELDADAIVAELDTEAVVDALDTEAVVDAIDAEAMRGALSDDVVLHALTGALDSGDVDDERLDVLREHLAPAFARSDDVRRQQLRARLEDFAAYADGLEALIDEHGTATEIIDDLRADIDATVDDLTTVETAVDAASGGHESVAARLADVDDRLETLSGRLDTLTERLDTIDTHLERADERHERLDARVGTVDGRIDTVVDDLQITRTSLQTLERTCESSMTELAETLAAVQDDITEIDRWRAQVGEAFTLTSTDGGDRDSIFRPEDDAANGYAPTDAPATGPDDGSDDPEPEDATAGDADQRDA